MSIDDTMIWIEANRDVPARRFTEEIAPQFKQALCKDMLEGLPRLCEDDKIKVWNFIEQYLGIEDITK